MASPCTRGGPVVALAPLADKGGQVKALIGQGVGEFVRQHHVLGFRRRRFGNEQLLAIEIVKGGGLIGQQIHRGLRQVEIRRR